MPALTPALLLAARVAGATDAVAIGVTVVATLVVVAMLAATVSLVRTAHSLRLLAERLDRHSAALLADLDSTVASASADLARVDDLIGSAESITATIGSASRLAYASLANPVIKVMAFGAGTARAGRRLRGSGGRWTGRP